MVKAIFQTLAVLVAILAAGAAFLVNYSKQFQVPPASLSERGLTCESKPGLCTVSEGRAPDLLTSHGRWRKSSARPNVGSERDFQFKRWNYVSFSDQQYFVGAALVKFYYISDIFLYVVNKSTNEYWSYSARLPLGVGLDAAYSSMNACSSWGTPRLDAHSGKGAWIELCGNEQHGLHFLARVPIMNTASRPPRVKTAIFDVKMKNFEDFIVAYPLDGDDNRLVYVHKIAGMPVAKESFIDFDENRHVLRDASAGLDWTKGRLLYRTFWRWVSLNDARAEITRGNQAAKREYLGINLSQDVYDVLKPNGDVFSCENAIWISGRVYPLMNPIEITVPADPRNDLWTIKSVKPTPEEDFDLVFRPYGARSDDFSAGFIISDFIQPYGRFHGTITIKDPSNGEIIKIAVKVDTAYGVVENHRAFW